MRVDRGLHSAVLGKPPENHTADRSKEACVAPALGKRELTFVNEPGNDPWFPWDIDGNGTVDLFPDIFGVANHFGDTKP